MPQTLLYVSSHVSESLGFAAPYPELKGVLENVKIRKTHERYLRTLPGYIPRPTHPRSPKTCTSLEANRRKVVDVIVFHVMCHSILFGTEAVQCDEELA